jgi:hypothetical protein
MDLNLAPPEYNAGVPTTRLRRSVTCFFGSLLHRLINVIIAPQNYFDKYELQVKYVRWRTQLDGN